MKRKRCVRCRKLTYKWQTINGGPVHCFDGCYSTTGRDIRTYDGKPLWLKPTGPCGHLPNEFAPLPGSF